MVRRLGFQNSEDVSQSWKIAFILANLMKTFNCCIHILQHFIQVFTVCQITCNCAWLCKPGPEVIKLFSCSTQLSTKFILLINVKMPTVVGILTFISMINATSERLKAINFFICRYFSFYEWLKFRAQLS